MVLAQFPAPLGVQLVLCPWGQEVEEEPLDEEGLLLVELVLLLLPLLGDGVDGVEVVGDDETVLLDEERLSVR